MFLILIVMLVSRDLYMSKLIKLYSLNMCSLLSYYHIPNKTNLKLMLIIRCCWGLPWQYSRLESACLCRGHRFDPRSGKIPYATEQLSPCITTVGPESQSPRATTATTKALEPMFLIKEATSMRRPRTATKSNPHLPNQIKPVHNMKTQHSQKQVIKRCCQSLVSTRGREWTPESAEKSHCCPAQ